jgi:hypothetical protein
LFAGSAGEKSISRARIGGTATIARFASTVTPAATTLTPLRVWLIERTGAFRRTRLPSEAATFSAISCEPPLKRLSCAPPAAEMSLANAPACFASPAAAV